MTRVDDGELYLEIRGATEKQLRAGLAAARRYITRCGCLRGGRHALRCAARAAGD